MVLNPDQYFERCLETRVSGSLFCNARRMSPACLAFQKGYRYLLHFLHLPCTSPIGSDFSLVLYKFLKVLVVSKEETAIISLTEICQKVKERLDRKKTYSALMAARASYWFFNFCLLTFKDI